MKKNEITIEDVFEACVKNVIDSGLMPVDAVLENGNINIIYKRNGDTLPYISFMQNKKYYIEKIKKEYEKQTSSNKQTNKNIQ